jgi:hypothetical protein
MIIEYELQGTQELHKGVLDTQGFWIKCGVERCDITYKVQAYKIWSHFAFTYETTCFETFERVWFALMRVLEGHKMATIADVGFIREVKHD